MELDLKSKIQENQILDPKWILDLKSEIQDGIGSGIWNLEWNLDLRSKGWVGSGIWNLKWKLDLKSEILDWIGSGIWNV